MPLDYYHKTVSRPVSDYSAAGVSTSAAGAASTAFLNDRTLYNVQTCTAHIVKAIAKSTCQECLESQRLVNLVLLFQLNLLLRRATHFEKTEK